MCLVCVSVPLAVCFGLIGSIIPPYSYSALLFSMIAAEQLYCWCRDRFDARMCDFSVKYSEAFVFQYGTFLNSVWNRKFNFI